MSVPHFGRCELYSEWGRSPVGEEGVSYSNVRGRKFIFFYEHTATFERAPPLITTNTLIVTCLGLWQSAPHRNTYRVSVGRFLFSFMTMVRMMCLCARPKHMPHKRNLRPKKAMRDGTCP